MTASAPTAVPVREAHRPRPGVLLRILVGTSAQPIWIRPAVLALLALTATLYLWALGDSGTANSFYAAAVQAGSESWKAWFFGSLDASSFITVDKPPASLWVMGLSARIFGFSSWSLLAPQALMGVASVALVVGAVRRSLATLPVGAAAMGGLLAGATLALTPAAALMFRFDNPDALLVLLMTLAAYAVVRALPRASWRWLALAGVALGLAFLTKMLQGLLVLPALGVVYLLAAQTTVLRRLAHLGVAAVALVVAAGWWVLAVALWPSAARPYIGGSTDNTVLDLVFGYNGLGRILGGSGNGSGGGSGTTGSSFGGATGLQRLFSSEMGLEISWLLPTALLLLVAGLVLRGRAPRTDGPRAALLLWGGWLVVTGLVFSFMSGTVHPYYTVALAPAIGALVGIGGALAWSRRESLLGRGVLAAAIASAGVWSFVLLSTNADSLPWLRWTLPVGALLSAAVVLLGGLIGSGSGRRVLGVAVLSGVLFGLGGTSALAVATASVPHSGSIPTVGSGSTSTSGGMGGGTGGAPSGSGGAPSGSGGPGSTGSGSRPTGVAPGSASGASSGSAATGDGAGAATGGEGATSSAALTKLLKSAGTTWSAAVNGSQSAATLELSSDTAVMAIGGWSSDPTPTLAQFEAFVNAGEVRYYVSSGWGGAGGGSGSTASAIQAWVSAHYTASTVGGSTVYDLTDPS
jgi:4-amino-4-deoxy-L-arabinose transferase-like glycosyltransferase